jgi:hypothetical protein
MSVFRLVLLGVCLLGMGLVGGAPVSGDPGRKPALQHPVGKEYQRRLDDQIREIQAAWTLRRLTAWEKDSLVGEWSRLQAALDRAVADGRMQVGERFDLTNGLNGLAVRIRSFSWNTTRTPRQP